MIVINHRDGVTEATLITLQWNRLSARMQVPLVYLPHFGLVMLEDMHHDFLEYREKLVPS